MPNSDDLKTSFDFPPKLTYRMDVEFLRVLREARAKYGPLEKMTVEEQLGVCFQAAVKAKLLTNWQSEILPDPDTNDLDSETMVHVIYWVGELSNEWWQAARKIPKVSFTTRLTTLLRRMTRTGKKSKSSAPGS